MASEPTLKRNINPDVLPKDHVESQGASTKDPEKLPWFVPELKDLRREARDLFEGYSKIPSDEVVSHIKTSRDKAFKTYPYPCLGGWGFLELSITQSKYYQDILQRIKDGDPYLDVGCCVGQDIRKLVFDGAPSQNTYGSDLEQSFIDIGYELFLDKATLKTTFIAADILSPDSDLKQLYGKIDVIHVAAFLHLFNWDNSVKACKQLAAILKAKPGSMVLGRQVGHVESGEKARLIDLSRSRYRHTAESFEKMWKQVGEETGTEWKVEAQLEDEDLGEKSHGIMREYIPVGSRWLRFTIWRV
ncbi:hypothetical protein BDV96DRAFT_639336 [Lophiotrema nucula]|uniref:Methyltransferase domain-containing protein n=1 Tax=Lophiotrema nucula TaxID=690887 RepID=A0A6A5ZTG6_9PLEO|nr:hypothetical protein BDV96DRAFT_639336 [Lophiotrema nucula]